MTAISLNSQLVTLSTLTQQQAGGNADLAEDISKKALDYIAKYEDKIADGNSTEKLDEDVSKWITDSMEDIAAEGPIDASAESVFAALSSDTEAASGELDVFEQLEIIANINADQIFGDTKLAEELTSKANDYIADIEEARAVGGLVGWLEEAAVTAKAQDWIDGAVEDIAAELAAQAVADGLFTADAAAAAEPDEGASASSDAAETGQAGAAAAEPDETAAASADDADTEAAASEDSDAVAAGAVADAKTAEKAGASSEKTASVGLSGESVSNKEASTDAREADLEVETTAVDERLEAMKRALAKLSAISSGESVTQLSVLVGNGAEQGEENEALALERQSVAKTAEAQQSFIAAASAYGLARSGWTVS